MASRWHDLGIALNMQSLERYQTFADTTKAKFKVMLRAWLDKQDETETKLTICKKFVDALESIDLIVPAEEFKEKAIEAFGLDW